MFKILIMQKMFLVPCFKQHILICEKYNYVFGICVYIYIFLFKKSGNFLTRTIILLIFIRRVHVRENRGKERKNKK